MKFEIDTAEKVVKILSPINIKELFETLNKWLGEDLKDYKLISEEMKVNSNPLFTKFPNFDYNHPNYSTPNKYDITCENSALEKH